jgi:hypothetical protein
MSGFEFVMAGLVVLATIATLALVFGDADAGRVDEVPFAEVPNGSDSQSDLRSLPRPLTVESAEHRAVSTSIELLRRARNVIVLELRREAYDKRHEPTRLLLQIDEFLGITDHQDYV